MARQVPGIDVIFMGHTHREVADTTINGVLLTQAGHWAAQCGRSHAVAGRDATRRVARGTQHGRILRPVPTRADRAFLDSLRWPHERTVAWVNARIGTAPEALPAREGRVRDTPIIDFINEVQRRAAGAQLSSTAAFQIEPRACPPATSPSRTSRRSTRTTTR
jgi:2',3'-cyclic-nucleotide 2'-phosphodiesterase (5'-nucleotidase family)